MRLWKFSVEHWQFTLVLFGLLIAVGANSSRSGLRNQGCHPISAGKAVPVDSTAIVTSTWSSWSSAGLPLQGVWIHRRVVVVRRRLRQREHTESSLSVQFVPLRRD